MPWIRLAASTGRAQHSGHHRPERKSAPAPRRCTSSLHPRRMAGSSARFYCHRGRVKQLCPPSLAWPSYAICVSLAAARCGRSPPSHDRVPPRQHTFPLPTSLPAMVCLCRKTATCCACAWAWASAPPATQPLLPTSRLAFSHPIPHLAMPTHIHTRAGPSTHREYAAMALAPTLTPLHHHP